MKTKILRDLFGKLRNAVKKQPKPALILCIIILITAFAALCLRLLPRQPEEPRYTLQTGGSEINFRAPDIKIHTAADGIAVVGVSGDNKRIVPLSASLPIPSESTSSEPAHAPVPAPPEPEATAPVNMMEAATTHSGFTMPVLLDGDSIGVLTIPDIDISVRVYETGDDMADMAKGLAHFKSTSAWAGNIALSGHNINLDGSDGHFLNLHTLAPGAMIVYETALGLREYAVESVTEIAETDWSMLGRTDDNRITLITCISGRPEMRLCVQGVERTRNDT